MSAGELLKAAELLRGRAMEATPGSWQQPAHVRHLVMAGTDRVVARQVAVANGPYIAMMSPKVGLALADWLGSCASRAARTSRVRLELDPEEREWYDPALTIARLILGDEA